MNNPKIFFYFLFSFYATHFYAQNREYAPVGATWQYEYVGLGTQGTLILKVVKDTVINGEKVKKQLLTNYYTSYFSQGQKDTLTDFNLIKIKNDSIFKASFSYDNQQLNWKYFNKIQPQLNDTIIWESNSPNCYKGGKLDSIYEMRIQDSMYRVARYKVRLKLDVIVPNIDTFQYIHYVEGIGFIDDYNMLLNCNPQEISITDMCFHYGNTYFSPTNSRSCGLVASSSETEKLKMTISPNPVNDILNVEMSENTEGGILTMTNVMGQTILTKTIQPFEKFISVEAAEIKNGIYIIQLRSNSKKGVQKLIIQH